VASSLEIGQNSCRLISWQRLHTAQVTKYIGRAGLSGLDLWSMGWQSTRMGGLLEVSRMLVGQEHKSYQVREYL